MLCSSFTSKLYLKLTCFCSFVFCFYITHNFLKNVFPKLILIFLFCLLCDPWQPLTCSLPCCKEFLIGQFLCHPVSVWATRKRKEKKNTQKIKHKKQFQHQH